MVAILPYEHSPGDIGIHLDEVVIDVLKAINNPEKYIDRPKSIIFNIKELFKSGDESETYATEFEISQLIHDKDFTYHETAQYKGKLSDGGLVNKFGNELQLSERGKYILEKEELHGLMYVVNLFNGNYFFAKPDEYERANEEYRKAENERLGIKV